MPASENSMYPKLISIGTFFIPTYGLLVAVAFLLALFVANRLGRRAGLNTERVTNLGIYCALMGLLGAKVFMILFDLDHFAHNPADIFSLSTLQAAGVFHGGLIAAVIFAYYYTRRFSMPWLLTADVFAPAIALGHAIGRIGCFMAGCCYGVVCDRPWAVTYTNPEASAMSNTPLFQPLHPTQLYETGAELLVFGFLLWRWKSPRRQGEIIGLYLILSSVLRFAVEFYRFHEQGLWFGLSLTQWISVGLAILGAAILLAKSRPVPAPAH